MLVVDDDAANRELARAALEDEGYEVVEATDGVEAVAAFSAQQPDCILLDVRMPRLDGFGACEQIRALPGGPQTPVIFLTALRDLDTFDRALRSGGAEFLTKPVRVAELLVRVQTQIRLRGLGHELRDTFDVLRRQRDELARVHLQKERLAAFIIHDLKNPIHAIDLNAQLLARDKGLSERGQATTARIRREVQHMLRLVLNLLDVGKAEEGLLRATRGEVDLGALVREVFEGAEAAAREAEVTLRAELDPACAHVQVDRDLLSRVLDNLVENALRHAPSGGAVTIAGRREGEQLTLKIADNGPGIPPELRERLFDRYVQADPTAPHSRTGRGLGLAFCRAAAEAHGGTIWIEDAAPGAAFLLRFPA